ncbi:MAG: aminotransferase class V-fold PLP-dependent enzyme, partial [Nanoarchaeota archaeon]
MQKIIYFDNGATTKIAPEVLKEMQPYLTSKYANASSQYSLAEQSAQAIKKSREKIAKSIHAKPEEIIFTSGGTES